MRVLISGAGIAGPALAWFLARTGADVTVIDKSRSLLAQGQNIDINGSAVRVVQKMGLLDEIRRFNTTEKGTRFVDTRGKVFAQLPVNKEGMAASFTSPFEILRGDLATVLYEATKDLPNVKYRFGTTVKEVLSKGDSGATDSNINNSNGVVRVKLSKSKEGAEGGKAEQQSQQETEEEIQEFSLLVAADGQWSNVRKQCFPPATVKLIDKEVYAIYWTVPRLPRDDDWWNIYVALGSRVISLRPDPHGTIRAMFTCMPNDSEERKRTWREVSRSGDRRAQEELLRREFSDAGWEVTRLLDSMKQANDFYFQSIQQLRLSKWSESRVVCLGDAAYAPTPLTGMGASLAILGAYVLGGELSKLSVGEHPSRALESYDRVFRPFVEDVQNIPFFVPGIAHPKTEWKRQLLRSFLWSLSKIAEIPWVVNRFSRPVDQEDFSLPRYESFESVPDSSATTATTKG